VIGPGGRYDNIMIQNYVLCETESLRLVSETAYSIYTKRNYERGEYLFQIAKSGCRRQQSITKFGLELKTKS
jgi:hypothetical protein